MGARPITASMINTLMINTSAITAPITIAIAGAFFCFPTPARAQETAAFVLAESRLAYSSKDVLRAVQLVNRALELAVSEGNRPVEAEARHILGARYNALGQYEASNVELIQSAKLFEASGDKRSVATVQSLLGKNAWATGRSDEARGYYNAALATFEERGDRAQAAKMHLGMSFFSSSKEEAAEHIRRGLELARETGERATEAALLQSWADKEWAVDDFNSAFERLEQARKILEQINDRRVLGSVLTSIGRLYRIHGHADKAFEFYKRARDIQIEIGDREGTIQSLNAMGVALNILGRHAEALSIDQQGLALARQTSSPLLIKFMLEAVANTYTNLGQLTKAATLLEEGRRMPPPRRETLDALSHVRFRLGQYQAALDAAQESIASGSVGEYRRRALSFRAHALLKLGRATEALADIREATDSIERSRANLVPSDFMKQGYGDTDRSLTALAIDVLIANHEEKEALELAERSRGRAFLDLLATKNIYPGKNVLASLPTRGTTPTAKPNEPESRNLSHSATAADMQALAARLNSTILSYWVEDKSTIIWTVSPNGRITSRKSDIGAETLRQWIAQTRPAAGANRRDTRLASRAELATMASPNTKAAWRHLYDALILPVRAELPATGNRATKSGSLLTIIPAGPLFGLSFAALLDERGRYLIEDYALHYAPAAEVFGFTLQTRQKVSGSPARYLLVANPSPLPSGSDGKPLATLPGADEEVRTVARILHSEAVYTLRAAEADESNVRASMSAAKTIHLATHGLVNDSDPLNSFLALGRTSDQPDSDGRLTAQEVYTLDLHADLVVLSACRTGLGRISNDGVAGLARAFFYAGAATVVATLWDVADQPAAQLIGDFYRSLAATSDASKTAALRNAQLHLLSALRKGQVHVDTAFGKMALPEDPMLWAGFVLMGEP